MIRKFLPVAVKKFRYLVTYKSEETLKGLGTFRGHSTSLILLHTP